MTRYQVNLGSRSVEILLGGKSASLPAMGNVEYSFDQVSPHTWLLNISGRIYTVTERENRTTQGDGILGSELSFQLGDRYYVATVDDERSLLAKSLAKSHTTTGGPLQVKAPMPGLISRVEVSKGDKVSVGQGLLILEAMKMENEIRSPEHGIISDLQAKKGVPVEKGEVLLTIQPD